MQFIRPKQVLAMIGVSKVTLWRMVRAGKFPAPVTIGTFAKAYVLEEVQEWMATRAIQRKPLSPATSRAAPAPSHARSMR